ncbi:hypothetical protein F4860DRAFT_38570 [Xylaria cubensis]|nr:hypothetical protein F4860DRAFT_38570 [Xylaria cubensis]
MFCWFLPIPSDWPRYPCFTRYPVSNGQRGEGETMQSIFMSAGCNISVIMEGRRGRKKGRVGISVSVSTALHVVGNTSFYTSCILFYQAANRAQTDQRHVSPWIVCSMSWIPVGYIIAFFILIVK